jgi:hypothetical protein
MSQIDEAIGDTDWRKGWFHFVENDEDGLTCPMAVREYKAARKLKRKGDEE